MAEKIISKGAGEVLGSIRSRLEQAGVEDWAAESWIILEWVCDIDREQYFLEPETPVPADKLYKLQEILDKRADRIPLQYLMGSCEFMGHTFYVNEHVLIPRQDTECLVEECFQILQEQDSKDLPGAGISRQGELFYDENPSPLVLDLCTGSGCIGISIKKRFPAAGVTLSDISEGALAVARKNAHDLSADVTILQGDLFEHIKGSYHMIVSNPPYIPSGTLPDLMPEVRDHEPWLALDGSKDGLAFYRRIAREAKDHLKPGGHLVFEMGMDQGEALKEILTSEGYSDIEIKKDLAGLYRITKGRLKPDQDNKWTKH